MVKNNTAGKIKTIASIIGLLAIFAGIVGAFVTNTGDIGDNAEAIESHEVEDKARDDEAHEDIEKLEKATIGIEKDIKQIREGQTRQETLSKERYIEQKAILKEISKEIRALPK